MSEKSLRATEGSDIEGDPAYGFDRFWAAHPRKVGKKVALMFWKRQKAGEVLDKVLAALESHKRSDQWTQHGGKYIPHPTTWLRERRWEGSARRGLRRTK